MIPVDLTGQRFHRWSVLREDGSTTKGEMRWLCRCDCGVEKAVASSMLRYGRSKSCGCYRINAGRARGAASRRHGEGSNKKETPEYRAWSQMLCRCGNPRHKQWGDYGGRGITVCGKWRSYEAFLTDVGRRPDRFHSLDRIDVDGNYEPGNVRWATAKEQNRNQRKTVRMTIDGVERPFQEWLELAGITRSVFFQRCSRGASPKEALFETLQSKPS